MPENMLSAIRELGVEVIIEELPSMTHYRSYRAMLSTSYHKLESCSIEKLDE